MVLNGTSILIIKRLILLKQFKNCLHKKVATYIYEHKDLTLAKAAVLADEFVLTHKTTFTNKAPSPARFQSFSPVPKDKDRQKTGSLCPPVCHYYREKGQSLSVLS